MTNNPGTFTSDKMKEYLLALLNKTNLGSKINTHITNVEECSTGRINQVFKISCENGFSFIAKYAPPFSNAFQDISIADERNTYEAAVLTCFKQHNPAHYPEIYHLDKEQHIILMQDLSHCKMMRDELLQGKVFPHFSSHVINVFATYLGNIPEKPAPAGCRFSFRHGVAELQQVTKDFVFECPFGLKNPEGIECLPDNHAWVEESIFNNASLQEEREKLENLYYQKHQALLHGDLHTEAIMVSEQETYFIDPEFSHTGPIGFDIGMMLANMIMSAITAQYHVVDEEKRAPFVQWLIFCIERIWQESLSVLEEQGLDKAQTNYEINGFCAIEIIRRVLGKAHVQEFSSIAEQDIRADYELFALSMAIKQLTIQQNDGLRDMLIEQLRSFNHLDS